MELEILGGSNKLVMTLQTRVTFNFSEASITSGSTHSLQAGACIAFTTPHTETPGQWAGRRGSGSDPETAVIPADELTRQP